MKVLRFDSGAEPLALDFKDIQKLVESPRIYPVPLAPSFFKGAMNFHNHIVPVLDLPFYFETFSRNRDSKIIVLNLGLYRLALEVCLIEQYFEAETMQAVPESAGTSLAAVTRLVVSGKGQTLRLLEPSRLKKNLAKALTGAKGNPLYLSETVPHLKEHGHAEGPEMLSSHPPH